MSGVLGSGKDVVIELSADYVARIIQSRFSALETGCFEASSVDVPYEDTTITLDEVRRVVLLVEGVSFTHTLAEGVITSASIILELRLAYAQVLYRVLFGDDWKTLDEIDAWLRSLNRPPLNRTFSYSLGLDVSDELERVVLSIDASSLPDYLPSALVDLLPRTVPIPINFLNQSQVRLDEAGNEQVVRLLTVTVNGAEIKSIDGGHLAIGLDVELSQDENPMVLRPGLEPGEGPVVAGPDDLVHHRCGLPDQPLTTIDDTRTFRETFSESVLAGEDWAIALDKHVVDAILRGLPSAGMNEESEEPRPGCDQENATRSFCLRVQEFEAGSIRVRASGEVFLCPAPGDLGIPVDELYNTFWEVCADADVTLRLSEGPPRRLVAHYALTDVRPCGDDNGFNVWLDMFGLDRNDRLDLVPARFRERDIRLRDVPTSFGDLDDPMGRLTISEAPVIRADGLVLRGVGSASPPRLSIDVPPVVMFARGCQEDGQPTGTLRIRNDGQGNLYICAPVLRSHPVPEHSNAVSLFRITAPPELMEDGAGLLLRPGESRDAVIECTGEAGGLYLALLDIPNAALRRTVTLNANFRDAVLGPTPDELRLGSRFEKIGCHWPPYHSATFDLEVTNQGPGNLEICSVRFSRSVRNVFRASKPGVIGPDRTGVIQVTFAPLFGDDAEYEGTMRIVTNTGEERSIAVFGRNEYVLDELTAVLSGRFGLEIFCGDADWDGVTDTGGRILDVHELERFLSFLGGENCCPAPRGPACLCVDLLEVTVEAMPPTLGLEVVNPAGEVIAFEQSDRSSRSLLLPFREGNGYALRARIPPATYPTGLSQLSMRRWFLQQEGLYHSSQRLNDVAVLGDYAYLAGSKGLEVVSLTNTQKPGQVTLLPAAAGITAIVRLEHNLLVARGGLDVYGVSAKGPKILASLRLNPPIQTIATRIGARGGALAYGIGQALHVVDVSRPDRPRKLRTLSTRVKANRAFEVQNLLYIFGDKGIEVFDLTKPEKPRPVQYWATRRVVRNALLTATSAILVYDGRRIDRVNLGNRDRLQVIGSWRLESWMSEFVPVKGSISRFGRYLVLLTRDGSGMRLVRIRGNSVDQKELEKWRRRRSKSRRQAKVA